MGRDPIVMDTGMGRDGFSGTLEWDVTRDEGA